MVELPQKAEDPDAFEHWVLEVRKLAQQLATRFAVDITEAKLTQAIQLMNRERSLRRQLADLMVAEPPPLTGRQLLDFKSIISGIEADLQQYERALRQYAPANAGPQPPAVSHQSSVISYQSPVTHHASRITRSPSACCSPASRWCMAPSGCLS